MDAESLKTELQQVLDNDLALRKEYNELRRSLSDYRNQLISRDEDCKRLQVTIDVLHTKLSVLDRDNGSLKGEIAGLREIEASLNEELQARQGELEEKLAEIHDLKAEISRLGTEYEEKLLMAHNEAAGRLGELGERHMDELTEVKAQAVLIEESLRSSYEERICILEAEWEQKVSGLETTHAADTERLRNQHTEELVVLREQYNATLTGLSATSHEQQAELKVRYETRILDLEQRLDQNEGEVRSRFEAEATLLRENMDEQRHMLAEQLDRNLESMAVEYAQRESRMRQGYESRMAELRAELATASEELAMNMESRVAAVKANHEELLSESCLAYESRISELINIYEDKISNLLIHANASTSRLSEELVNSRTEAEKAAALAESMTAEIEARNMSINELTLRLQDLDARLLELTGNQENVAGETPAANLLEAREEELASLSEQLVRQNQVHSEYVTELNTTISRLTEEVDNMSGVFENMTNDLGLAENELELKESELASALQRIAALQEEVTVAGQGRELRAEFEQKLAQKELEFQKLLVENNALIADIEDSQRVVEIQQAELTLLRAELGDQQKVHTGKVEDLKETLAIKNAEIAKLEASSSKLEKELDLLRGELLCDIGEVPAENTLGGLQDLVNELTSKVQDYEGQLSALRSKSSSEEQEAYIDRLFKQIDHLNHQQLQLLDEKEQMAAQLLKMNSVLENMSQQVDSEHIDVTGLNNHRKNTILAGNSKGQEDTAPMRKQINELVREIDKCIALLSA